MTANTVPRVVTTTRRTTIGSTVECLGHQEATHGQADAVSTDTTKKGTSPTGYACHRPVRRV